MAAKKRPTSSEVKGLLLEGNFANSGNEPLPLTDPISITQMVLSLEDIKPYDKNPRREINPLYEEIKHSIRSKKQLNNNFNVTRRPGDDLFMVESGGNTRLAILNELYLETADEVFNRVHCLFVPWQSESTILTAHLIENEIRGDMMLIDKAYAVQELKQELEIEIGKKLSDIKFTRLAADKGYNISAKLLRRFNYAVFLDQMIPLVLRSGIGGHKIDFIKKVEKAYQQYCKDKTEQFDAAFMAVMSDSDTDESWNFEQTRLELDDRLASLIGIRYNLLRLEVDAILSNQTVEPVEEKSQKSIVTEENRQSIVTPVIQSDNEKERKSHVNTNTSENNVFHTIPEHTEIESEVAVQTADKTRLEPVKSDPKTELKRARKKGFELACKIANAAGIEAVVMEVSNGLGFLIEYPHMPLSSDMANYYTWWLLLGISEQKVSEESHYSMWSFTDLYDRLGKVQQNQDNNATDWIGPDPGAAHLMFELLHKPERMTDQTFTHVFRLMENCRKLTSNFSKHDIWTE